MDDLIQEAEDAIAASKAWRQMPDGDPAQVMGELEDAAQTLTDAVERLRAQQRAPVTEEAAEAIRAALDRFEGTMMRLVAIGHGGSFAVVQREMRALRKELHVVFMRDDVEAPPPRQHTPRLPRAGVTDELLREIVLRTPPKGTEHTLAVACLGLRQDYAEFRRTADELATAVQNLERELSKAQDEIRHLQTCGEIGGHRG